MVIKIHTPVLFLIFNRLDTTQHVFQAIRKAQPPRLYIAADGPRKHKPGEAEKSQEVRDYVLNHIDWDCEVNTLFRENNLGCKYAVSGGIDWFFDNEEMGIILEDDVVPDLSFFQFCEVLLDRYKDDEKIMTISGNNFQPKKRSEYSYYFSKYMHCWGWASWRKAWKHFDVEMKNWPKYKRNNWLSGLLPRKHSRQYWENIFDRVYKGEIDSWAYIWTYSIWIQRGINILPEVNLVSNIGFGNDATHTKSIDSSSANLRTKRVEFPLQHPNMIATNDKADKYTQLHHFQKPLYWRVIKKLQRELLS